MLKLTQNKKSEPNSSNVFSNTEHEEFIDDGPVELVINESDE